MGVPLVLAVGLALLAPFLPVAWAQGYPTWRAAVAYLSGAATWWAAAAVARRLPSLDSRAGDLVRTAVVAVAAVVATGVLLATLHALSLVGYLSASLALAALAFGLDRANRTRAGAAVVASPGAWILGVALGSGLVALALGFAATHAPLTLYDAPSYHLYFAARWLQDHAVSILPTPFSDEAQAYAPANGELFLVWLMAPWHGDFLARAGQLPFWFLGAGALYALARHLGAARAHALYPALFFLVARPVVEQAIGANVDLIAAALFAASIYLGLVAVSRDTPQDWAVWGIAVGLTVGTKYVLLPYLPVLLTIPVASGLKRRALWAMPGLVAFGASWYLRNWIVAGSPIYPASLTVAGLTVATGAFTRAAMLNTVFHTEEGRLALVIFAHAFGVTLALAVWPLLLVGIVTMLGRPTRRWWPDGWLILVPVAMAVLFWRVLPVNIDSRFFLPAVGPALIPLAMAFGSHRVWNLALHALYLAALLWMLVGVSTSLPMATPWYMAGWLDLHGVVAPSSLGALALVAGGLGLAWLALARSRWMVPFVTLLIASTGSVLALGEDTRCAPVRCDRLSVTDPDIRGGLLEAWDWMNGRIANATVAYTGINLPYPLAGSHLTNRVVYVNLDGHLGWRFHDYDRAYRAGRFAPVPPPLAVGSGELEPVSAGVGPRDDASRPRYERLDGVPALWVGNLDALGVGYVFIARLSAYEVDYQVHGPDGFPIEDAWAQADPGRFTRVFDDEDARIYAVRQKEHAP
jgi:hypothetical protein